MIILRGPKFEDGKTGITIQPNMIIKHQKAMISLKENVAHSKSKYSAFAHSNYDIVYLVVYIVICGRCIFISLLIFVKFINIKFFQTHS